VRILGTHLLRMAVLVLLAGLGSTVLLRFSPGALVDERELDSRASTETLAAIRSERAAQISIGGGLIRFFGGALHGNLGKSQSLNTPIADLLRANTPATLRRLGAGLAIAWVLGLGLAIAVASFRRVWRLDVTATLVASLLLSLPAGALAYLCLTMAAPVEIVLMLVLLPRVFRYSRNLLVQAYGTSHIDMARALGVTESRILFAHVFRSAAAPLLALLPMSLSMALGAIIPIEAICDAPGIGRLAWQAAMARDLPLLLDLTMLIALATTAAMVVSDVLARRFSEAV
jgi:peptide/nickel transport system permease protein